MSWFRFRQNNSGGHFHIDPDKGMSVNVFVEAPDAKTANNIAEDTIGIYFDDSDDCSCCGPRWYAQWDDKDGLSKSEVPEEFSFYDENSPYISWVEPGQANSYVHPLNKPFYPAEIQR